MVMHRLTLGFVVALYFLATNTLNAQQVGGIGGFGGTGTGATGSAGGLGGLGGTTTGGQTGAGGLGGATGGLPGGLLNQPSSFSGFTQNFGSGNSPFVAGTSALGASNNGIGMLAGGASGLQGQTGRTGLSGLGGIGGGLGGFGSGLGGIGGGLGGIGGGLGGRGFGNNNFGQNSLNSGRTSGNQGKAGATIRTMMKPSPELRTRALANAPTNIPLGTAIKARMERMPLPDKYRNVQVSVVGRTAVLTGAVSSEADARFVARLVSLETGIDSVESQLTMGSAPIEAMPVESNP